MLNAVNPSYAQTLIHALYIDMYIRTLLSICNAVKETTLRKYLIHENSTAGNLRLTRADFFEYRHFILFHFIPHVLAHDFSLGMFGIAQDLHHDIALPRSN